MLLACACAVYERYATTSGRCCAYRGALRLRLRLRLAICRPRVIPIHANKVQRGRGARSRRPWLARARCVVAKMGVGAPWRPTAKMSHCKVFASPNYSSSLQRGGRHSAAQRVSPSRIKAMAVLRACRRAMQSRFPCGDCCACTGPDCDHVRWRGNWQMS